MKFEIQPSNVAIGAVMVPAIVIDLEDVSSVANVTISLAQDRTAATFQSAYSHTAVMPAIVAVSNGVDGTLVQDTVVVQETPVLQEPFPVIKNGDPHHLNCIDNTDSFDDGIFEKVEDTRTAKQIKRDAKRQAKLDAKNALELDAKNALELDAVLPTVIHPAGALESTPMPEGLVPMPGGPLSHAGLPTVMPVPHAILQGSLTVFAVKGKVTFSDLSLCSLGDNFKLIAVVTGTTDLCVSDIFNVVSA